METNEKIDNSQKRTSSLDVIKAISVFLSTIIISLTGTFLSSMYNSSQLEINRNKELSVLIPKLNSPEFSQRFDAIVELSLYGKNAVLPLISKWTNSQDLLTNNEVLNSLLIIGKDAIPYLLEIYHNTYEQSIKREWCLVAIVKLKYKDSEKLITEVLTNNYGDYNIVCGAVLAAGEIKCKGLVPKLVQICDKFRDQDNTTYLVRNIAFALGQIGGSDAKNEIKKLLNNSNLEVRRNAVLAMANLGDKGDITQLFKIGLADTDEQLRSDAKYIIKIIEIKSGL